MNRFSVLLVACLLSACASTRPAPVSEPAAATLQNAPFSQYEQEDLVSVQHNRDNAYTLLIYRNALGQVRYVLRRQGVCEMVLTRTETGALLLKERGRAERPVDADEAHRLTRRLETLVNFRTVAGATEGQVVGI